MKLLLVLPTAGSPAPVFLESLGTLDLPPSVTAFERLTVTGNYIPGQRELAARRARAMSADIMIMLDDDMVVPPHALAAIVDAFAGDPQLGIVGALYYSRDGLRPMAATHWSSGDTTTAAIPAFTDGLTYVDAIGFGCVGVRVSALDALRPPYYSAHVFIEESANRVRICNEDYLLCERMREAGFRIGLHAGIRCKHFDRASGIAHPLAWEDATLTAHERMLVVEPGPTYRLLPYDAKAARASEHHARSTVDYISLD